MKTMKICFKCAEEKPLEEYYTHPQMGDKHLGKCKECTKRDVRLHRRENESVQAYDRRRFQEQPHRRKYLIENAIRRAKEEPEKSLARRRARYAVKTGKLTKPKECSRCKTKERRIEGHHEDYNKPLEVRWLCSLCHRRYT